MLFIFLLFSKAHIPQEMGSPLVPNANEIYTKKHEMYMANASILRWDPTQPIFHLLALGVGVGENANFRFGVGENANFSVR